MNFRRSRTRSRRNSMNIMVSTEKWRNYARKLSQRATGSLTEDSEDDVQRESELKDWVDEFFVRKSTISDESDQDVEVNLTTKQTLVLATLVPDEILLMDNFQTVETKRFVGVLMMADVSGYTALSERYHNTGKGGTYRLTATLNAYLGSLIEVIYSNGGDIIKFAGDAFLALWKTDKRTFLCHTIHTAIACALIIQHSFGSYETDVKVSLKVKLAISAGNLIFSPIGSGIDMNYIIFGLPVIEAKLAESLCGSGEVKLTPTAWAHCYSRNYDHIVSDDGHVTIKSILYDPRENDVSKPFLGFGTMIRQINKPLVSLEDLPDLLDSTNINANDISKKNEVLSLRKTILKAGERNIGSEIRKFMIRPVLTQIDAHQPLEYLTEMRQVSILFITLKPKECSFPQLITIVNNSYQITSDIVYKSMGCVNKIILFDKDVMILVIFGLRGFKHESEAQAALKCAYSIQKRVSALDGVLEVSIGVTTGQVYCGVVGHPLRREFTVIGAIVNKAARFMCNFRNKITCDEATYIKSKISSNGFSLQQPTELKGIIQPGNIYEYTEDIRIKELFSIPLIPPLLNRYDEMEYFQNWLSDFHLSYRDFDALLLIGESRIGKTRLLEWMARYARNKDLKVCYLSLTSIHLATPYLALSQILENIMELKEPILGFEKEEKIVSLMQYYSEDLCYLNNIIKVHFAYHEDVYSQDENVRKEKAKKIFKKLLLSIPDTRVIFLDDLQNLDPASWEFLTIIFDIAKMFTVITVTRGKFSSVHSWLYAVFIAHNIRKINLGPLDSYWIAPLACQILDVQGVPNDLCNALRTKCNGMPGLVESFIVHLFSSGALELKNIAKNEVNNFIELDLQFPDSAQLRPIALNERNQAKLNELIQENSTEEISICLVINKDELEADINVQNVDALIIIQIDSLTPYQQLLLKIASVIGNVLSRELLENIMYDNNPLTTAKAIKRLFAMRILSCANVRRTTSGGTITSNYSGRSNLTCECSFEPESTDYLPKYAYCKVMKFRNKSSRRALYELLPLNQKKEFHSRVVNYFENNKQKCPECGGTVMVVQSSINLLPQFPHDNTPTSNGELEADNSDSECVKANINILYQKTTVVQKESSDIRRSRSDTYCDTPDKDISQNISTKSEIFNKTTPILKTTSKDDEDIYPRRRSAKRVTMSNVIVKNESSVEINNLNIFNMIRAVTQAKNISEWHDLGVIDSEDNLKVNSIEKENKSFCIHIEKGVSQTNFSICTCAELNVIIFEQLIYHSKEADLKTKMIEFLIQYSHLNIQANNFDAALPKLEDAEHACQENSTSSISWFEKQRFLGKIYSLKAAASLMSGRLMYAKLNIVKAAKIYNINLNKISDILPITSLISVMNLKRKKHREHIARMKADSIFFLNVAVLLYSTLDDEQTSRVAALRCIRLVQQVECGVIDLCDAFSNGIQMELDRGSLESTLNLEKIAINALRDMRRPIQADELFALGKVFMTIFHARLARGQLAASIRSGFRALVVSRFLYAHNVSVDIIPDLFYLLLSRCRIEEAVNVVKLLTQLAGNQITIEHKTWYYALSIDLVLDAGLQLESPNDISQYAEYSIHQGNAAGESRRRLVVGLWTYWLRADSERRAKRFETEALLWSNRNEEDCTLKTIISAIRLAEGMLESLARKMDDLRKVVDLMELRSLADRELTRLEKDARDVRAVYPRWILLKANSLNLSGRQTTAITLFNQALEESRRIHNRLEEASALAATSNFRSWIQNARYGNFLHWSVGASQARRSWKELLYKITTNRQ